MNTNQVDLKNLGTLSRPFFLKVFEGVDKDTQAKFSEKFKEALSLSKSYHEVTQFLRDNGFKHETFISKTSTNFEIILNKENMNKYISLVDKYISKFETKKAA